MWFDIGILFSFLSALFFAFSNLFVKKGMSTNQDNSGYFISVICNFFILGLVFLISLLVTDFSFKFSGKGLFFFIIAGLLTTGFGRFLSFKGIKQVGPSRASIIKNGSPIFTILFGFFVLGETMQLPEVIGILLVIGGILTQGYRDYRSSESFDSIFETNKTKLGFLFLVLSALSFGIGQGVRKQGLLISDEVFFGAWIGAITSLVFVSLYEYKNGLLSSQIKVTFSKNINRYYLVAGFLTSLGALLFFLGASYTQVSYVSVIVATEPLLTVLLSSLIFNKALESITTQIWITSCIVIIGTIIIAIYS